MNLRGLQLRQHCRFHCQLEQDLRDVFLGAADFFFDGLIADWYMQSKINNSYESVSNVKNHVNSVLYKLQQLKEQETLNVKKLEI